MTIVRNPQATDPPATYHHGVEVSGAVRTLYVAGQIGMRPDGTIPSRIEEQTRVAYANLSDVLTEADMDFGDVVKSTVYLVRREDRAAFTAVRSAVTGGAKHASTLLFVFGLALPDLLVEIEAIAVRAVDARLR